MPLTSRGVELCSEQAAKDAILYSYRHGFSGFAAVLTDSQAARLAGELTIHSSPFLHAQTFRFHVCVMLTKPLPLSCAFWLNLNCGIKRFAWGCASGAKPCS